MMQRPGMPQFSVKRPMGQGQSAPLPPPIGQTMTIAPGMRPRGGPRGGGSGPPMRPQPRPMPPQQGRPVPPQGRPAMMPQGAPPMAKPGMRPGLAGTLGRRPGY